MISSSPGECFESQRTSVSDALFSRTVKRGIAAMHSSFRALHQQSLVTSLARRHNYRLTHPISSQILAVGTLIEVQTNYMYQPTSVPNFLHYNDSYVSHWASRYSLPVPAVCSNLSDLRKLLAITQVKCGDVFPQLDYLKNITVERGQFFETPSVLSQIEMPKRKRSHSEHPRSKHKTSKREKSSHSSSSSSSKVSKKDRSSGSSSKVSKKKCEKYVDKSKVMPMDQESKKEIYDFISSMRRKSKRSSRNTDSVSTAKSSGIESGASLADSSPSKRSSRRTRSTSTAQSSGIESGASLADLPKQSSTKTRSASRVQSSGIESGTSLADSSQSKGSSTDTDSASAAQSSGIESVILSGDRKHNKNNVQSTYSQEMPKSSSSAKTGQQSQRTQPPGWSSFAQMKFLAAVPSTEQKQSRSQTPPPDWSSFAQRKFSTTAPSVEQTQHRTRTPPPAQSYFSTSVPLADQQQGTTSDSTTYEEKGPRKRNLFEFRRHWRDSSLGRKHKTKPYPGMDFVVMSYNLLAQNLIHMNDYLYRHCSPRYILDWNYRKQNLLREMANVNADIVCLQEVQGTHYTDFYEPEMARLGYHGLFKQRTGDKQDGCATFYKTAHFDLINYKLLEYHQPGIRLLDRDNVAVVVLLRPKGICESERICVANTHLLYNPKRGDIKLAQLGMLLAEIDNLSYIPNSYNDSRRYHPAIMCGDFNSVPQSSLVDFVQTGTLDYDGLKAVDVSGQEPWKYSRYLSCPLWPGGVGVTDKCQYKMISQTREVHEGAVAASSSVSENNSKTTSASDTTSAGDSDSRNYAPAEQTSSEEDNPDFSSHLEHPFHFISSYPYNKDSKEVTTNHGKTNCTVDYIFHSSESVCHKKDTNQLRVLSRWSLFTDEEATDMGGLPNARWSSDHFSLAVKFLLTPNDVGATKN